MNYFRKSSFQWFLVIGLSLLQVIRLINFIIVYGGVEHDSGWFLGVARSLAENGTYSSMVSTFADPTVTAGPDLNGRYQLQDERGGVYFFVELTTGPSQILADAIILKLFGPGFWQFRVATLLFYLLLLTAGSWLLFSSDGIGAALLFHAYLFFYPHLSIFLGYEALGEVTAMTFVLFSFLLYSKATAAKLNRIRWFFLSGLLAGLAITAKLLAVLPLAGLGLLWLILYLQKKASFKEGLVTGLGLILVPLLWVSAQLITIVRLFGLEAYLQHTWERIGFFLNAARDPTIQATNGTDLFWYKFFLISEISQSDWLLSLITLVTIAVGGLFLIWHFRGKQPYQNLAILLYSGWLIHTGWFIGVAKTGWVRHYWPALILAILIICLLWAVLLRQAYRAPRWFTLFLAGALTLLLVFNFSAQRPAMSTWITDQLVNHFYDRHLAAFRTRLPWIIIPRAEQEAALDTLRQLPASARIFYPAGHKSAEMAVLSGRILYPIERRSAMPPAKGDVILVGPSLISPWTKLMERPMSQDERQGLIDTVLARVKNECPKPIFENNYYIICALN